MVPPQDANVSTAYSPSPIEAVGVNENELVELFPGLIIVGPVGGLIIHL
jgi:hypothetical protein